MSTTLPQAPKKSYGLFVFGCILLIIVDFLWTLSSVLVQKLLDEYYNKPIIITYCSTSVFALYVPFFYLSNWVRTFFYSCRIRRALRERYQNEAQYYTGANETTSLIHNSSYGTRYSDQSDSSATKLGEAPTHLSFSSSGNNDSPYNDPSVHPYLPNSPSNSSSHEDSSYLHGNYSIDDRIDRDMDYLDGVNAEKDSQLYEDIRSYRVLNNERGWKVFKHNFKTGLIVGPLWYTMNVTYNSALKMVSVSTNTILSTTAGFFVLLIGLIVFCVPVRKLHLFCVALAIFGSFLVVVLGVDNSDEDPDVPHGLFDKIVGPSLCLLSAFLYGLYSVVIEYFTDKEKPLDEQKDSIAKQRKEAEEEEIEEQHRAEIEATALFVPKHNSSSGNLDRSHSINTLQRGQLGPNGDDDDVSVHVENHMMQTSFDITTDANAMNNFGFGVCKEQHIIENLRADPTGASLGINPDELELVDSDEDEEKQRTLAARLMDQLLPNYDVNDPKLVTGLLFGCVGLINLVFAWPFIGLFHFTGFETLAFPDKRAIPMLVMNSFLGAAASDFLWANAVILTSPIIATLTIPGTIPIAMCYETFFLKKPLSMYAVLGSILIVASSSVVTIQQYKEDKMYDNLTKKMLEKRAERKEKDKVQRKNFRERQRQIQQLISANNAQNALNEMQGDALANSGTRNRHGSKGLGNNNNDNNNNDATGASSQPVVARPEIGAQ